MSQQRARHTKRQPLEETARLGLCELVGAAGTVESERHAYDWREDDVLMWVRLKEPITDTVLSLLRRRLAERINTLLPPGQPLHEWLIVIECDGVTLSTVAWHEMPKLLGGTSEA